MKTKKIFLYLLTAIIFELLFTCVDSLHGGGTKFWAINIWCSVTIGCPVAFCLIQLGVFKRYLCSHESQRFIRNVYGDEINQCDCRSLYQCEDCKKIIKSNELK